MTIDTNEDFQTVSIDQATLAKLTTGTAFQRSLNLLGYMTQIMDDFDNEILDTIANKKLKKKIKKQLLKHRKEEFTKLLPSIDQDALNIHFG